MNISGWKIREVTMKKILLLSLLLVLQGCTWVKLSREGEQVKIVEMQHVKSCKLLGKTTVSVKASVAGIERKDEEIQEDLEILARNNAANIKGDTIVPLTEIKDGNRTYNVYRCKN